MNRNTEIDGLRSIGALAVLCAHVAFLLYPWSTVMVQIASAPHFFNFPCSGIPDFFFVITGYLVSKTLRHTNDLYKHSFIELFNFISRYFVRRFLRIFPIAFIIYLTILAFSYAFNVGQKGYFGSFAETLAAGKSILTCTFNYAVTEGKYTSTELAPYWFLSIEDLYYFFIPFFLILVPSDKMKTIFLLSLLFVITFYIRPTSELSLPYATELRSDGLLYGCLLYILTLQPWITKLSQFVPKNRFLRASISISLILVLIESTNMTSSISFAVPISCFVSSILVLLATLEKDIIIPYAPLKNCSNFIAKRGYIIYLIHVPIICLTKQIIRDVCYTFSAPIGPYLDYYYLLLFLLLFMLGMESCYQFIQKPFESLSEKINSFDLLAKPLKAF